MITQIYSLVEPGEAAETVRAGADRIGVLTGDEKCPCCVTEEKVAEIFAAVGDSAEKVLISMAEDIGITIERCSRLRPDIIHLCGKPDHVIEDAVAFRKAHPEIRIMLAVAVRDESSVETAKSYAPYCDNIILDTDNPALGAIGAAGITNDWNIGRAIVEAVDVPVILAGGLGPDNVQDAIRAVRPAGVDSLTKTSIRQNGKLICKNLPLVREFCRKAKETTL